jgi:hypothetical protein
VQAPQQHVGDIRVQATIFGECHAGHRFARESSEDAKLGSGYQSRRQGESRPRLECRPWHQAEPEQRAL